jgi:hypothetical protein
MALITAERPGARPIATSLPAIVSASPHPAPGDIS